MAARSDAHGNVEPCFDFVYLDGAKNWTIDGLAVILIEKLLRPGGWLLMDDLDWTYAQDPGRDATDGIHPPRAVRAPSCTEPHLRAVFDLIVAQHPSLHRAAPRRTSWWGWARKAPGEPRRYSVETSRPLGALAANAARKFARRARRRLASSKSMTARATPVRVAPRRATSRALAPCSPRASASPSPPSRLPVPSVSSGSSHASRTHLVRAHPSTHHPRRCAAPTP